MPAPIDLTGKQRGWLKIRRLTKKRDAFGRRLWLCKCKKCGKNTLATTLQLNNGSKQSCGCLRHSGRCGRRFTKKAARAEHNAKAELLVDGRWWYAPRRAAQYMNADDSTLSVWTKRCPWLDGQAVETRELPSGYGRIITYYAKDSLDKVKTAQSQRMPIPTVSGHVYIGDLAQELGWSQRTLRRRMLDKRITPKKVSGKSVDLRARPRSYVPDSSCSSCSNSAGGQPCDKSRTIYRRA
jgi:hypothetical protein